MFDLIYSGNINRLCDVWPNIFVVQSSAGVPTKSTSVFFEMESRPSGFNLVVCIRAELLEYSGPIHMASEFSD